MASTDLIPVDPRLSQARTAALQQLRRSNGTPETTRAEVALKAALDTYGIPNARWPTGGGCTARGIIFDPAPRESTVHVVVHDDASMIRHATDHGGWGAAWFGPQGDDYFENEIYNNQGATTDRPTTFADLADDSARCAQAIRNWYDGTATTWTRNEVVLAGMGPYRCETRSEFWDGYCAPRFTRRVMEQLCADTQAAHRKGAWDSPITLHGDEAVIETPAGSTTIRQDGDDYFRPGCLSWPWEEHADMSLGAITGFLDRLRRRPRSPRNGSYFVIAADHGWRVKVIDVIDAPCPEREPDILWDLGGILHEDGLTAYELPAHEPSEAAERVRAHFRTTRADRDPDARVQMVDVWHVELAA